jgi:hypothetical protein
VLGIGISITLKTASRRLKVLARDQNRRTKRRSKPFTWTAGPDQLSRPLDAGAKC